MAAIRTRVTVAVLSTFAALTTCRDATGPSPADLVARVVVSGRSPLRIGETVRFTAGAHSARDSLITGLSIAWASSAPGVATVDTAGLVHALVPGQVSISASVAGKTGALALTVTVWPVVRIAVTPAVDSLLIGDSLWLRAVLYDSLGDSLTGRPVVWRVSDTAKAEVSASGLVRVRAAGGFAVSAESEGQRGGAFLSGQLRAASLTLPDTVTLDRRGAVTIVPLIRSASGGYLADRAVDWASRDAAVAGVSASGGEVTPVALGRTWVTAVCCNGLADSSVINVVPVPLKLLVLEAPGPWVVGTAGTVYVTPWDSASVAVSLPISWSTPDTSLLSIVPTAAGSAVARVTPLRAGPAWLVAAAGGRRDSVRITAVLPVRRLRVEPDTVTARVGQWVRVFPTLRDSTGEVRDSLPAVSMRALDSTIAGVSFSWNSALVQGRSADVTRVIVSASHGGLHFEDTASMVVYGPGAPSLAWDPPSVAAGSYAPSAVAVVLRDSAGAIPATGSDVVLSSSDTSVATVVPTRLPGVRDRAAVTIHPRRAGTAVLVARTDSASAALWVNVHDVPIAALTLTAPAVLDAGDSVLLGVNGRDALGNAHEYPVVWGTSDSAVAVVRGNGYLVGRSGGRVLLTAQSANVRDSATVIVRSLAGITIDSIAPALVLASGAAAVVGSGFDPNPANNAVTVDGVPAVVTNASAGRLEIRLAAGTEYPCALTHRAVVSVASGGAMAATTADFSAARQLSLAVGDTVRVAGPAGIRCLELAPRGSEYVITVANQVPSAAATAAFELIATTAQPTGPAPAPGVATARATEGRGVGDAFGVDLPASWRDRALHQRVLEESRRLAARAGPPAPLLGARPRIQASVGDSVGGLVRFRIPQVDRPDFCSSYWGITARRAFHGQHIDIFEDVAGSFAGRMDAAFAQLGAEFDEVMYPILLANFGDPLALDSLLDRNGRITLLVSPRVRYQATAFVVSCDFYPESVAPSSNTGETIYAFAPWEGAADGFTGSPAYWQWVIRSVLMHESKHIVAFAQRLARGAPFEESWLEEGSAVVAEELWARTVYHTSWRGNAPHGPTLYCDVRPREPACAGRPYAMFNAFAFLHDFSRPWTTGNEVHTPLGPSTPSDASFYGSAWSLLRWSIDQYAADESAFLRALVGDPSGTGVANLEVRTGRPYSALVADWLLALQSDDQVGAGPLASPPFTLPSWNLRDIFAGMARDFPRDFSAIPFGARRPMGGTFTLQVPVLRGGTASASVIAGQPRTQLLEVRSLGGGPPPAGLEFRILRQQ